MICQFCHKEAPYVPLDYQGRRFEVFYCYDCKAEYVEWAGTHNVHLYTTINGRMYRWSVEVDGSMGRLWYVAAPGVPGKVANQGVQLVKNFWEIYPTITPQNIQDKLRFILLFL